MSEHIAKAFDEDLAALMNMLAQMGGRVEQQLDHATNSAENIHYLVHAKPLAEGRPKNDITRSMKVDGNTPSED